MLGHSCLSSMSHFGLTLALRVELVCVSWSPLKGKKVQMGINSSKLFPQIRGCEEKVTTTTSARQNFASTLSKCPAVSFECSATCPKIMNDECILRLRQVWDFSSSCSYLDFQQNGSKNVIHELLLFFFKQCSSCSYGLFWMLKGDFFSSQSLLIWVYPFL